jgi:hypothetical protein
VDRGGGSSTTAGEAIANMYQVIAKKLAPALEQK